MNIFVYIVLKYIFQTFELKIIENVKCKLFFVMQREKFYKAPANFNFNIINFPVLYIYIYTYQKIFWNVDIKLSGMREKR